MLFNSTIFLFLFLPIFLAGYFLVSKNRKNLLLLLASLLFYTWGESSIVLVLLFSAIIDFSCGLLIEKEKRKIGLGLSLISNISILWFFKYLNFSFDNANLFLSLIGVEVSFLGNIPKVALPIGVSFFTFQTMSYTIDVYRGKIKASKNFIDFASYVCMFPQLIAGPIIRYSDINKQLVARTTSIDKFSVGIERFIIGLSKKVLVADTFAAISDSIFSSEISELSTVFAWVGIISFTIQIYFDFSGYSDMAIGIGKMLGFDFIENFNYPYISKSIGEFWKRWHISLSTWFRDYVYISIGGNRKGIYRTCLNLLVVFLVSGFWHGSNWTFVVWGLYHAIFVMLEKIGLDKRLQLLWKPIQHIYTLVIVAVGFVFFRLENLPDALLYIKRMFVWSLGDEFLSSYLFYHHFNLHTILFFLVAVICSVPVCKRMFHKVEKSKCYWIKDMALFGSFILSIIYMNALDYSPFLYFRF